MVTFIYNLQNKAKPKSRLKANSFNLKEITTLLFAAVQFTVFFISTFVFKNDSVNKRKDGIAAEGISVL